MNTQLVSAINVLSHITADVVANAVTEILIEVNDNKYPNDGQFTRQYTFGQVRAIPNFTKNEAVCREVVATYLGRYTAAVCKVAGVDIGSLDPESIVLLMSATSEVEEAAVQLLLLPSPTVH